MSDKSLGQIAYEAWCGVNGFNPCWGSQRGRHVTAWEEAAKAVIVAATEPERLPIPSHSLDAPRLSDLPPECHPPTVADMAEIDGDI